MIWRMLGLALPIGILMLLFCGGAIAYGQSVKQAVLAYVREEPDHGADIHLYDITHGLDVPLLVRPGSDYFPTWSPDGNELAFIADEQNGVLYVIDVDGSDLRALPTADTRPVSEIYGIMEPGWTSNGEKLVMVRERPPSSGAHRYLFYLIDPQTGEIDPVSDEDAYVQEYLASFRLPELPSPDGLYLLRPLFTESGNGLFILNVHTREDRLLHQLQPSEQYRGGSFSWSDDGAYVAFTVDQSARGGSRAVSYILNIQSQGLREIGSGSVNHSLAWRP